MKVCYKLGLSSLGPYQYKMIAEDFVFEAAKIKQSFDWNPTLTNEEMLLRAYMFYKENKDSIKNASDVPAHRQSANMGIIRLLKYFS
jgi:hypothetical protein